jgi:ATP-dependent DNA ligase
MLPIAMPSPPMEANLASEIPAGRGWQYEPKWDGFRCIAFRSRDEVELQSKAGQTLTRYFPEIPAALLAVKPKAFVLDGELIVALKGRLSFDNLLHVSIPQRAAWKCYPARLPPAWSFLTYS